MNGVNMKRASLRFVTVLLITLFSFAGCQNAPKASLPPAPVAEYIETTITEDNITQEISKQEDAYAPPFFLPFGGTNIHLGAYIDDIISKIGEPLAVFDVPSCAFDGMVDIVFRFPGVQLHTLPIGNEHFIHTMFLVDDTLSTYEGIFIGSEFYELTHAYGHNYTQELGMYTFTRGDTSISFLVNDGIIMAITYELYIHLLIGD